MILVMGNQIHLTLSNLFSPFRFPEGRFCQRRAEHCAYLARRDMAACRAIYVAWF